MRRRPLFPLLQALRPRIQGVGALLLVVFLFSANALLFSSHAVTEFSHHDHVVTGADPADSPIAPSLAASDQHRHEGDGQNPLHDEHESCCDSHSHASLLYQPLQYRHAPVISTLSNSDPFRMFPEVWLDKFIPPQNLA